MRTCFLFIYFCFVCLFLFCLFSVVFLSFCLFLRLVESPLSAKGAFFIPLPPPPPKDRERECLRFFSRTGEKIEVKEAEAAEEVDRRERGWWGGRGGGGGQRVREAA